MRFRPGKKLTFSITLLLNFLVCLFCFENRLKWTLEGYAPLTQYTPQYLVQLLVTFIAERKVWRSKDRVKEFLVHVINFLVCFWINEKISWDVYLQFLGQTVATVGLFKVYSVSQKAVYDGGSGLPTHVQVNKP